VLCAALSLLGAPALTGCAPPVQTLQPNLRTMNIPPAAQQRLVVVFTAPPAVAQSADWSALASTWNQALAEAARGAGVNYTASAGPPRADGRPGTLATVQVLGYRYAPQAVRTPAGGVLAKDAYVNATVTFSDLLTGQVYGERGYNTTSPAWEGVFTAVSERQLQAISREMLGELRARPAMR